METGFLKIFLLLSHSGNKAKVAKIDFYKPEITEAKLEVVEDLGISYIQLNIYGHYLDSCIEHQTVDRLLEAYRSSDFCEDVIPEKHEFILTGSHFDKVMVRHRTRELTAEAKERFSSANMGFSICIRTAFGEASSWVHRIAISNLQTLKTLTKSEPVSIIIRKCLQRCMSLYSVTQSMKTEETLNIITNLIESLDTQNENKNLKNKWDELREEGNFSKALSNKQLFEQTMEVCKVIESQISDGERLQQSLHQSKYDWRPFVKKLGRHKVIDALIDKILIWMFDWSVIDKVEVDYVNMLVYVIGKADAQFCQMNLPPLDSYINDRKTYELEEIAIIDVLPRLREAKALNQKKLLQGFHKQRAKHKKSVLEHQLEVVSAVHELRSTLFDTCYVGVVGLQNCGKSTLINKIWNVGAPSGHTTKTKKVTVYKITEKFHVVDYPGSQGIDHHTTMFAQCGIINNLIIVVLRYDGEVDNTLLKEVETTLAVVKGSNGTARVIFCVNKADRDLYQVEEEVKNKKGHKKAFEYMRDRHLEQLRAKWNLKDRQGGLTMMAGHNEGAVEVAEEAEEEEEEEEEEEGVTGEQLRQIELDTNYFFTSFTMDDPGKMRHRTPPELGICGFYIH